MNEKQNEAVWIILLALLFNERKITADNILRDLENELSNKNRYFPNDFQIKNVIELYKDTAIYKLNPNDKLFRSRSITDLEKNLPKKTKNILEKFRLFSIKLSSDNRYNDFSEPICNIENLLRNPDLINMFDKKLLKKIEKDDFWGYSKEESDAPPIDKATAGRANPSGISYLYAADNLHTAIVEARPIIRQIMSVAEIKILNPLKLFDFCAVKNIYNDSIENEIELLNSVARRFSTPNYINEQGYLLTQYIAEMIKIKLNFDGIRFQSSLDSKGNNIVLFNEQKNFTTPIKNYEIKNTSLHIIDDISVKEYKVLPLKKEIQNAL